MGGRQGGRGFRKDRAAGGSWRKGRFTSYFWVVCGWAERDAETQDPAELRQARFQDQRLTEIHAPPAPFHNHLALIHKSPKRKRYLGTTCCRSTSAMWTTVKGHCFPLTPNLIEPPHSLPKLIHGSRQEGQRLPQAAAIKCFKDWPAGFSAAAAASCSVPPNQRVMKALCMPTGSPAAASVDFRRLWIARNPNARARLNGLSYSRLIVAQSGPMWQVKPARCWPSWLWPIPPGFGQCRWRSQSLTSPNREAPWNMLPASGLPGLD